MTVEWFEDPVRLLRVERLGDDTTRQAVTATAELIWDDLLDSVETDTVEDELLTGLLPGQFRDRAAGYDGRTAVRRRAHRLHPDRRGRLGTRRMVDLDVPDGGMDVELWVEEYLADVDHELLYDPALHCMDDDTTDHQYGLGAPTRRRRRHGRPR